MKFKANRMEIKKLISGNTEIALEVEDKQNRLISQINGNSGLLTSCLEVSLDKWRNKRSLGHNALFWDMCNYLADHINDPLITANTIYKDIVREHGVSTIYPVEDEMLDMIIKDWESRGEGWLTLKLRKSNLDGNYTNVKFWFGSSVYNSKQFWKLVEGLKETCRDNDLDISQYDSQLQDVIKQMEEKEQALQSKQKEMENNHGNSAR